MKKHVSLIVILLALMGISMDTPESSDYSPILMTRTDLEKSVKTVEPQDLKKPGKIYFKGDTLYIIESFQGIHVINDSDPSNPAFLAFITVPGIVDISIKNNVLFADNAVDLVSIDIKNLDNLKVLNRVRNVFPELVHPISGYIPDKYRIGNRPKNTIIVNWKSNRL